MRTTLTLIAALLCLPALAQEQESVEPPPVPQERPAGLEAVAPAAAAIRPAWTLVDRDAGLLVPMPRLRPAETLDTPTVPAVEMSESPEAETTDAPKPAPDVLIAVPEVLAPPRVYQVACPAVLQGKVEARMLPPVADGQCGAQSPLEVSGVLANGRMVPLSSGITTDCGMATALPEWVAAVDSYLMGRENTQIAELIVGTSYMCRRVNNASEGNLSFHAFADAVDVTGFRLEDGRTVTVEGDWAEALSPEGRLLRYAHGAACSHFTTVLGPEANALHHDHFHIDLGCHGKTCTARLCE
jgi:hypothetical protein